MMKSFARTRQLLGESDFAKLKRSSVAVFGLGGVGSYALEGLARAAVGTLRVVDFDTVKATNMNRQLLALVSTVGQLKTEVARCRVLDINPSCNVDVRTEFAHGETLESLLSPPVDVVIDAIDSVSAKVRLIQGALSRGLPVVSSMGAAVRTDPAMVRVGDISETQNCRLAKFVRKKLHKLGIRSGLRCVYSIEEARNKLACDDGDIEEAEFKRGRTRTPLGSISYLPAIFGLTAASEAIRIVLGR